MKKVISGALQTIVGGILLIVVFNLFQWSLGSIVGGSAQASGLAGSALSHLLWEGVIGPLEVAIIAFVLILVLAIIVLSGLVGLCSGGLGLFKQAVGRDAGSVGESGRGIGCGWLILLTLIGFLALPIVISAIKGGTPPLKEALVKATLSVATVNPAIAVFGGLVVFGLVGFLITLALLVREIF